MKNLFSAIKRIIRDREGKEVSGRSLSGTLITITKDGKLLINNEEIIDKNKGS